MITYQSRKKGGNGTIKVIDLQGNLKELPLKDYALSGFQIQEVEKHVKAPVELPFLRKLNQSYAYPNTQYTWLIEGSFFTPETTVSLSGGVVVDNYVFINDNFIEITFTTYESGLIDLTIDNGVSKTFSKVFEVFQGVITLVDNTNVTNVNGTISFDQGKVSGIGDAEIFAADNTNFKMEFYFSVFDAYGDDMELDVLDSSGNLVGGYRSKRGSNYQWIVDSTGETGVSQTRMASTKKLLTIDQGTLNIGGVSFPLIGAFKIVYRKTTPLQFRYQAYDIKFKIFE